jgi:hypothetical protein
MRNNFPLRAERSKPRKPAEKAPLARLVRRREVLKPAVNAVDLTSSKPSSSQGKLSKYRRNRVYYEETHLPVPKKVYESLFESKKPLRQKTFPILF